MTCFIRTWVSAPPPCATIHPSSSRSQFSINFRRTTVYRCDLLLSPDPLPPFVRLLSPFSQPDRRRGVRTGSGIVATLPKPSPTYCLSVRLTHSSHATPGYGSFHPSAFTTCYCRVTPTYSEAYGENTQSTNTSTATCVHSFTAPAK